DHVTLGDGEDEVAGGDIDLPGAELFGVEPIGGGGDDVLDRVRPGRDERVRHARNGEVLIRLSAPVSRDRVVLLSGAQPVVHVAHEHAVLNQHVAAGRAYSAAEVSSKNSKPRCMPGASMAVWISPLRSATA